MLGVLSASSFASVLFSLFNMFFVNKEKQPYNYNINTHTLEYGITNNEINNTMNSKLQNVKESLWISSSSDNEEEVSSNDRDSKYLKVFTSRIITILFLVTLLVFVFFEIKSVLFQQISDWIISYVGILQYILGIDSFSLLFVLLTSLTFPICIVISWRNIIEEQKFYFLLLIALEFLLFIVFLVIDLLMFYVFFEAVLIPLFLLIGIYGSSLFTRVRAGYLLFLYTLLGSLFMLLGFVKIINSVGNSMFVLLYMCVIDIFQQRYVWLAIFFSLAIKTPLVPWHIWLPRAHSEASLAVSVVLAGLVLKMACYGFIRVLLPILPTWGFGASLLCGLILSNYGDSLKLIILICNVNAFFRSLIIFTIKSLGKTYEINKNAVGYRVTKSQSLPIGRPFVKVQRVYGSDSILIIRIRGALMGLETGHQGKALFSNKRNFSTYLNSSQNKKCQKLLSPWFVTGIFDAEGCFRVQIRKSPKSSLMWRVEVRVYLELHSKDEKLLHIINAYFRNIGSVSNYKTRNSSCFYMSSFNKIITHIIPHGPFFGSVIRVELE